MFKLVPIYVVEPWSLLGAGGGAAGRAGGAASESGAGGGADAGISMEVNFCTKSFSYAGQIITNTVV